ncbi:MAG: aminotransferase class I/II-fold pyridoxal phosphate-dependent enzyme, partial [Nocardioidaceae bacterium]
MPQPAVPPLRRDLAALPRYVAGSPAASGPRPGFKLSSNELPHSPSAAVVDEMAAALPSANRYPSVTNQLLVGRIAATVGVGADRVVVGAGSIAVLQQLLLAVADPGRAAVFGCRSYEAYPIVTRVCHARPVAVPLRDHRHDLPAMLEQVRRTRAALVIVCNPNNPTGTTVARDDLLEFVDAVPP